MAVLSINYFSNALAKAAEFQMVLPNDLPPEMKGNNPAYDRQMKTFYLLHGFTDNADIPKLYMACGTEDFLIKNNRAFHKFLTEQNYKDMQYQEGKSMHDWGFWDTYLEPAILWLLGYN